MRLRRWLSSSTTTTAASLIFIVFFFLVRFTLIIICFSSIIAVQALAIPQSQALLKFKQSLANTTGLANWKQSTHPCSGWSGIRCLANTDTVWTLQLQGMGLAGSVDVDALAPLPRLRSISLMNNHFKGQFPRFNALGALKAIYISNNKFSGDIPDDAFAGMRSLKKVYMANNEFTGNIPSSLTYLSMLLELRLEGNRFEGQIPKFHQKQQIFLKLVNVSHNRLSGPIPQSLNRMDVSSFSGNENLCGKPLDPCASPNTNKKKKKISWKIATVLMVACIAIGAMVIVIAIIALIHSRRSKHHPDTPTRPDPTHNSPSPSCTASSTTNDLQSQLLADSAVTSKQDEDDDDNELCFVNGNEPRFDLQQLLRAPSEVLIDVVGGSLGCNSYKASVGNVRWVVVKRCNKQKMGVVSREEFEEHMRRLGRLDHGNVVPLVGYYYRKDEKLLLYEYVPNACSLASYLHGGHHMGNKKMQAGVEEWKLRLKIIKGVCKGLQYLYNEFSDQVIPHGHLKSSNVLIHHLHHDTNSQLIEPLLTDCALAPVTNPNYIHQLMAAYRSPESSHHQQVSTKSDIWCLGTLILELLTGKFPSQLYINYHSSDEQDEEEDDLSAWVASHYRISIENVLDKEILGVTKMCCNCKGQIMKLVEIGLSCCEKDVHRRLSIERVVHKVEQLTDHDEHNLDSASSNNAGVDSDRASATTI